MAELRTAAITLPLIWLVSLLIRVAAQQLAIGNYANQLETIVGPAGNLSTDHERLDGPVMFSYAIAGQVATASLAILGFVVSAAIAPLNESPLTATELLDFKSGWNSRLGDRKSCGSIFSSAVCTCCPRCPSTCELSFTRAAAFGVAAHRIRTSTPYLHRSIRTSRAFFSGLALPGPCSSTVSRTSLPAGTFHRRVSVLVRRWSMGSGSCGRVG